MTQRDLSNGPACPFLELCPSVVQQSTDLNPSSAVERTVVLICKGLRILNPRFLHYIFNRVFNGTALLG